MEKMLIKVVSLFFKYLNLSRLFHKMKNPNSISIVTYHGIYDKSSKVADYCFVHENEFEEQIKYLSENFHIVNLEDAFDAKLTNIKPKAVITFDDGFYNNFSIAYPILKKYNAKATIYLATNIIRSHETVWFCNLIYVLNKTSQNTFRWNNIDFDLTSLAGISKTSNMIQAMLKELQPHDILSEMKKISSNLGFNKDIVHCKDSPFFMLDDNALKEMYKSGLIDYGAHTHNHTILSKLKATDAHNEIETSIKEIESITQKKCTHFAYPNGTPNDFTSEHEEILRNQGILYSASTTNGLSSPKDNKLSFKRLFISAGTSLSTFKLQVHGIR